MKRSDPEFEAWFAARLQGDLNRLQVTTPQLRDQVARQSSFRRSSMALLSFFTVLKSQAVVIGATLLVGGVAIGMATTGSPNPIVWGVHLMDSNGPGGSTGAPSISTESSPEPTASPEPTNAAEPAQTPEPSATPEPKETPSPAKSEGESGDD